MLVSGYVQRPTRAGRYIPPVTQRPRERQGATFPSVMGWNIERHHQTITYNNELLQLSMLTLNSVLSL